MTEQTVADLLALGKSAENYFEKELEYDDVTFICIRLRPNGSHQLDFTLADKFQEYLAHDMKYKVGWAVSIPLDDFWDKVTTWPTREQRELTILARKMATIDANFDDIKSAQVRAFVARLIPDIDALRRQIADLRGNDDTVEIT